MTFLMLDFAIAEFYKNNRHENVKTDHWTYLSIHTTRDFLAERDKKNVEAAEIADLLNRDPTSPFYMRIKFQVNPSGNIAQKTIVDTIKASQTEGILCEYDDPDKQVQILKMLWGVVARVFPDAWEKSQHESKLIHNVDIYTLGNLIDHKILSTLEAEGIDLLAPEAADTLEKKLRLIADKCLWVRPEAYPDLDSYKQDWEDLQNTPKSKAKLIRKLRDSGKRRRT